MGGELNSIVKDKADVDVRFAFCFPDIYEGGNVSSWHEDPVQPSQPDGGRLV